MSAAKESYEEGANERENDNHRQQRLEAAGSTADATRPRPPGLYSEVSAESTNLVPKVAVEGNKQERIPASSQVSDRNPSMASSGVDETLEDESSHPPKSPEAGDVPSALATERVTYVKPKSFAERLMKALEADLFPKGLWWIGEGTAIALHTQRLKGSPAFLKNHLKVNDYGILIRNVNRW